MGKKRRKNRTHLKGPQPGDEEEKVPKSFVIKSGTVTKSVSSLVRDVRKIMEPNTATRLRERPNARLRDYLTIAPTLGVTHLMAFTLTEAANVHLRVARMPQGPTLTFRTQRYSLAKDLLNSNLRNIGKSPGGEFRNPPLLVLNGFQQPADGPAIPQLKLMSTMFQGLFPPIQVERSALPTFRRVLLLSYNHQTGLISMRHFIISVRSHGVSRRVRKLLNTSGAAGSSSYATSGSSRSRRAPNLSNTDDIADYLLRRTGTPGSEAASGYDSMSETDASEAESDTNAVELPDDYVGKGNKKGERKAVRLIETGPRIELKLIKIVEGLVGSKRGEGETVFHEFEERTKAQSKELQKAHEERRKAKDARRAEQAANVARKKAEKEGKKKGKARIGEDEDEEDDEDRDELDVDGLSEDDDLDLDLDPEEQLKARRRRLDAEEEDDEDEFDYEDREVEDEEDEEDDWDEDVGAGEASSEEEEEEDSDDEDKEEEEMPPRKRPGRK